MKKCPYTFPDRTRKGMIAYLGSHSAYWPMNSWNKGFVLSWNVKVYSFDEMGKSAPADYPVNDRFDEQWRTYINNNSDFFWMLCEDASHYLTHKEWTNWPGIEQGEWDFSFNGRSSGHLVLADAPSWCPAPRAWEMSPMIWSDRSHYQEWLAELDTPTLRQFYRAVRVMDQDFTRKNVESEISYQAAFQRFMWEEDLLAQEDCDARRQERDRPDLYRVRTA